MAQPRQVVSTVYPYLSIIVEIRGQREEVLALIDTGYTGDLVVPANWQSRGLGLPDGRSTVEVGDGRTVYAPVYLGVLEIIGFDPIPEVAITALGDEYILGQRILDRFEITLDHGQRVIVKP